MQDAGADAPNEETEIELIAPEEVAQEFDIGEAPPKGAPKRWTFLPHPSVGLSSHTSLLLCRGR